MADKGKGDPGENSSREDKERGERMATARQRAGISGVEIARRMSRSNVTVSRWENGAPIGDDDLAVYAREVGSTPALLRYGKAGLSLRDEHLLRDAEVRGFRAGVQSVVEKLEALLEDARREAKQGPGYRERLNRILDEGEAEEREHASHPEPEPEDITIEYGRPRRTTDEEATEKERRRRGTRGAGATRRKGA